ncbi:MAG: hypothetical protein K0B02_00900 [DPANN group archaeon]|nr:hypothetical protein [DPANN group archaeon]
MPVSKAPYKRGHKSTAARGSQSSVSCSFCGAMTPRHKCIIQHRGFRITDPGLKRELDLQSVSTRSEKQYACPRCARSRGIVEHKTGQQNVKRPPRRSVF